MRAFTVLNLTLLLLAALSWKWFFWRKSRAYEAAESRAFSEAISSQFLHRHLPCGHEHFRLTLNAAPEDKAVALPNLQDLVGKKSGPAEQVKMKLAIEFMTSLAFATRTIRDDTWKYIGEARAEAAGEMPILKVWEIPGQGIGFSKGEEFFACKSPGSVQLLEAIHGMQKAAGE